MVDKFIVGTIAALLSVTKSFECSFNVACLTCVKMKQVLCYTTIFFLRVCVCVYTPAFTFRDTPTSAGPNSFYKTAKGFTDPRGSWRNELDS